MFDEMDCCLEEFEGYIFPIPNRAIPPFTQIHSGRSNFIRGQERFGYNASYAQARESTVPRPIQQSPHTGVGEHG